MDSRRRLDALAGRPLQASKLIGSTLGVLIVAGGMGAISSGRLSALALVSDYLSRNSF